MPKVDVVRTHLELPGREAFRSAPSPDPRARVERAVGCPPSLFRWLYAEVGRAYHWLDRQSWTDEEARRRLDDPAVSLHVLSLAGEPAGYFELERREDESVEIAYFGLLPAFHGRGLGKYLLSEAVEAAFALGARRVRLHTCSLDDPAALPNYLARGFRVVRTETYVADLPDRRGIPPGRPGDRARAARSTPSS